MRSPSFDDLAAVYGNEWTPDEREQARAACAAREKEADADQQPFELTDSGNAERFAYYHRAEIRRCPEWHCWLVWDSKRLVKDDADRVRQLAKATCRRMKEIAAELDSRTGKELFDHAHRSESDRGIRAMLKCAESEPGIIIRAPLLDRDPMLLNVQNGTINLRTGELLPHDRKHCITKLAGVALDMAAECPTWHRFLDRIFAGNVELIGFIRRFCGYLLTGLTSEQVFVLLYGTGANGKSTLLEVLRRMLGEYATSADFTTFLARRSEGPRNDIARLQGARLVTAIEVGEGRRMDEAIVKAITGGDTITARYLYAEAFEYRPAFKLMLAANHRPVIEGDDNGIWRRVRLVPFEEAIPENERDPQLVDKLTGELPGILAWAVNGCLEWQRDGLGTPAEVLAATASYRDDSDLLGTFLAECCVVGPGTESPASDLYSDYKIWCALSGEKAVTQTAFGRALRDRGFDSEKSGKRKWIGVGRLKKDEPAFNGQEHAFSDSPDSSDPVGVFISRGRI